MTHGGKRNRANYKYRVIKKLRNRAMTFRDEAANAADRNAWTLVIGWLNSFRQRNGSLSKKGAIGIRTDSLRDL